MTSFAESEHLYLLYFGNRFSQVALFIFKDGFAILEDEETFLATIAPKLTCKYKPLDKWAKNKPTVYL